MTEFVRARNSTEAFWATDPFDVVVKPQDPRFADIEKDLPRAHYGVSAPVLRRFSDPTRTPGQVKFGILGQVGTGKSTLIRKAMDDLRPLGIMPVFIDVLTYFDQSDFGLPDVMLVIVRAVIAELEAQNIALDANVTEATYRWFADELLTHESRKQIEASLGVDATAGIEFPLLAKFSAKFASSLKTNNEYRTEIRQRAFRDINDLIRRVNLLLEGAHAALAHRKQQLCIVFDNLEKVTNRAMVCDAILVPAEGIRTLRCHIVFFLHPADEYAPGKVAASQAYDVIHVPALPVRLKGDPVDTVRPDAKRAIRRLLDARLELDNVFADVEAALDILAQKSGGHLRDLLRLVRQAAEFAEPELIAVCHIEAAARCLSGHRVPTLREQDWPCIVAVHDQRTLCDPTTCRHSSVHPCLLSYGTTPWWDVHPLIREHSEFSTRTGKAQVQS